MSTTLAVTPDPPLAPTPSSLAATLLDVLVSPADAFDNVLAAPPRLMNWLGPVLLVALASLVLLAYSANDRSAPVPAASDASDPPAAAQTTTPAAGGAKAAALLTCAGAFAGTFWSAFLLWFVGRVFLRTPFTYQRSLEVVALTGVITALGAIFTALLIGMSGDPAVRPALSLIVRHLPEAGRARQFLELMNFFQLWATAVLAIGLSRLSGVSFKEAAFWVFGYWLVARLGLIVLS